MIQNKIHKNTKTHKKKDPFHQGCELKASYCDGDMNDSQAVKWTEEEVAFTWDSLAGWRTRQEFIIKTFFIFLNFFKFVISKRVKDECI